MPHANNEAVIQDVFALSERNGRTYWTRIGKSFRNNDGSNTLLLDALPLSGKLQVRDPAPRVAGDTPILATAGEHHGGTRPLPFSSMPHSNEGAR